MGVLLVGDVHATPDELDDCENLLLLVERTAAERPTSHIVFMGDQYNTHDVVNTRCIEFWRRWFSRLQDGGYKVIALRGNHDQVNPTAPYPHSMLAHPEILVVDKPMELPIMSCAAMPYYASNEEFVAEANALHKANPHLATLFCHQTFQGASYENGFYAKDAIDLAEVTWPNLVSGHIHTPQKIGKAIYVGAPRWRIRSDANIERWLTYAETTPTKLNFKHKTPTSSACRKIWVQIDKPDEPAVIGSYQQGKDKLYIDVYGPTDKYVRDRETELKSLFGAVTRGFPTRTKIDSVSEIEGVEVAFSKFAGRFQPPNGTSVSILNSMLEQRLGTE